MTEGTKAAYEPCAARASAIASVEDLTLLATFMGLTTVASVGSIAIWDRSTAIGAAITQAAAPPTSPEGGRH